MLVLISCFSCAQLFATLWTAAHQASLSMGFSKQQHWSGLPCPSPGDCPGIKFSSPRSPLVLAGGFSTTSAICFRSTEVITSDSSYPRVLWALENIISNLKAGTTISPPDEFALKKSVFFILSEIGDRR